MLWLVMLLLTIVGPAAGICETGHQEIILFTSDFKKDLNKETTGIDFDILLESCE